MSAELKKILNAATEAKNRVWNALNEVAMAKAKVARVVPEGDRRCADYALVEAEKALRTAARELDDMQEMARIQMEEDE